MACDNVELVKEGQTPSPASDVQFACFTSFTYSLTDNLLSSTVHYDLNLYM